MKKIPRLIKEGVLDREGWNTKVAPTIDQNLQSLVILPGVGYRVIQSPGGQSLVIRQGSSVSTQMAFPFQCTLISQYNEDGSPAGNKVSVEYNSTLFTSVIPLTPFSGITGLFDPDPTSSGYPIYLDLEGPDDTTGYSNPNPDDYVILEIAFGSDGVSVSSASIETRGNGNTTDPTLAPWDVSGNALVACNSSYPYLQTYARIVLATYQDGELQQNVTSNLVLENTCFDGLPALYPVAY